MILLPVKPRSQREVRMHQPHLWTVRSITSPSPRRRVPPDLSTAVKSPHTVTQWQTAGTDTWHITDLSAESKPEVAVGFSLCVCICGVGDRTQGLRKARPVSIAKLQSQTTFHLPSFLSNFPGITVIYLCVRFVWVFVTCHVEATGQYLSQPFPLTVWDGAQLVKAVRPGPSTFPDWSIAPGHCPIPEQKGRLGMKKEDVLFCLQRWVRLFWILFVYLFI